MEQKEINNVMDLFFYLQGNLLSGGIFCVDNIGADTNENRTAEQNNELRASRRVLFYAITFSLNLGFKYFKYGAL